MKDYRGLVVGNRVTKSWRHRWEDMQGWKDIPNRGIHFAKKENSAEILIYEQIGVSWWDGTGVSAKEFVEQLRALGDVETIDLRINSPGGDVTEADAIYSSLAQHKATINVHIDGLAASAASYIAMAGDSIKIAEHAKFMIHNAWGIAIGNAVELRQTADVLDVIDGSIRLIYQRRTGQTDQKLKDWMEAETWFTAQETVDNKFATEVVPAKGDGKKNAADTSTMDLMRVRLAMAK